MVQSATKTGNRQALLFVLLFLGGFLGLYFGLNEIGFLREHVVTPWTRTVAKISAAVLGLFDDSIRLTGFTITKTGAGMTIVDGCNGITPLSLLVAGLLAFPTAWRARAIGLLVGVPAVFAINFLRVFALFVINAEYPEWYSGTHLYVAQAFVILATGGIWLWWLGRFAVGRNEAIDRTDS